MKEYRYGRAKISQLPSGRWWVRLSNGIDPSTKKQRIVTITGDTPKEVIKKCDEWTESKRTASILTVGKAIREYIDTCELAGHSPATIVGYEKCLRVAYDLIKDIRIDKLKLTDVQRQINLRAKDHSPKTIANEYGLLHRTLTIYAPNLRLDGIILPSKDNDVNEDAGIAIPTKEQLAQLLRFSRTYDPDIYLAILISSQTGVRRSELCAIEWQDVNWHFNCITINKSTVIDKKR